MNTPILEPFAAQLVLRSDREKTWEQWQTLLGQYLDEIGAECASRGIIGHIKGFSALPGGGYVRGSKTSTQYPADTELVKPELPGALELMWSLNVLVYGLAWNDALSIAKETARSVADRWDVQIDWIKSQGGEHDHHHYGV